MDDWYNIDKVHTYQRTSVHDRDISKETDVARERRDWFFSSEVLKLSLPMIDGFRTYRYDHHRTHRVSKMIFVLSPLSLSRARRYLIVHNHDHWLKFCSIVVERERHQFDQYSSESFRNHSLD